MSDQKARSVRVPTSAVIEETVEQGPHGATTVISRTFRIRCAACTNTIDVAGRTKRAAWLTAEEFGWVRNGSRTFELLCPEHEIPCPYCHRPLERAEVVALRKERR